MTFAAEASGSAATVDVEAFRLRRLVERLRKEARS